MKTLRRLVVALVAVVVALCAAPALAHTKSETHSSWLVTGDIVNVSFTMPEAEAKRLAKPGASPDNAVIAAYLAKTVGATAEGKLCPIAGEVRPVAAAGGYRRFEMTLNCPASRHIEVGSTAFLDLVPTHVNFAQIQTSDGQFVEQLLTADRTHVAADASADNPLKNASFLEYIRLGVMHIFTGADHMSFLLGLVLISRRLRDLTFVITGFTLGHSITLALAVTGVLRPHAEFIDALVALTIALIGAENVAVATGKPGIVAAGVGGLLLLMALAKLAGFGVLPPLLLLGAGLFAANYLMISGRLVDAGRLRLVVTLVFGLIHGFGFASDLLEMRLPTERLVQILFGFNLGVEIGQLTLVLTLAAVVWGLSKLRLTLPRPIVVDVLSAALVAIGTFWFVGRSFG